MEQLALHAAVRMVACPDDPSVEDREGVQPLCEGLAVSVVSVADEVAPEAVVGSPLARDVARLKAQYVPKEGLDPLRVVVRIERSLNREPTVLVDLLLHAVRESHEEPALELLSLGEGAAGRVQALEDLLRVVVGSELDPDHVQGFEARLAGLDVAGPHLGLEVPPCRRQGARSRGRRAVMQNGEVLLVVAVLEPELLVTAVDVEVREVELVQERCAPSPDGLWLVAEELVQAHEEQRHGDEALLAVDDAKYMRPRGGLRCRQHRPGVMRAFSRAPCCGAKVREQRVDVARRPGVAALPARNRVAYGAVEEGEEKPVLGLHGSARCQAGV